MFNSLLVTLLLVKLTFVSSLIDKNSFIYHGFHAKSLSLNGNSMIEETGLLRLTNLSKQAVGHAFYPSPFNFINSSNGNPSSFSTSFVFAIVPQYPDISAHGLAFVISPSKELRGASPSQYLGIFNYSENGHPFNHILAIEFDTVQNMEYYDINDNHVGIDINGLISNVSAPASYATNTNGGYENLTLISGKPMKVWVDYDGVSMKLDVTISPIHVLKPPIPLLSKTINLSSVLLDKMYVGFSSSTGSLASRHYILGWSFSLSQKAQELDISKLPPLPVSIESTKKHHSHVLLATLPLSAFIILLTIISVITFIFCKRRKKFIEQREDWEVEYGPHRISYADLYKATKGFSKENLLGGGGFGDVFKGVLPKSKLEIAVKRVSHESRQGMREFVAEIASIGRVRHRNLVPLLGYSRRQGELLLVYDYMPNGSLDKYLYDRPEVRLNWRQRFAIIKGIAAGLLYLHEEWDFVILHRDIKASNVLLDREFNGRLGDFGLARLHGHGTNLQTTHVVGTLGYLAPELSRTGKATTCTDVYAFGAFLLEVVCGKKPVELKTSGVVMVLVDWVLEFLKKGSIVEARDRRLRDEFEAEEVELVLKLGLLCSHPVPVSRPSMRQVVEFLEGKGKVPDLMEEDLHLFETVDAWKICSIDDKHSAVAPVSDAVLEGR